MTENLPCSWVYVLSSETITAQVKISLQQSLVMTNFRLNEAILAQTKVIFA